MSTRIILSEQFTNSVIAPAVTAAMRRRGSLGIPEAEGASMGCRDFLPQLTPWLKTRFGFVPTST